MRPTELLKDNTLFWVLLTYDADGILVDADSTPSVAVRKNGASTADSVTVTKRAATTGTYDCSYSPSGEVLGDQYTLEETATISSQDYVNSFSVAVTAAPSDATEAKQDTIIADVAALNDISVSDIWSEDQSSYTTAGTFGDNLDYRLATLNANVGNVGSAVSVVGATCSAIYNDTDELQQNQGDWLTATGFNTVAPDNASISAILADTNELQGNQGDWATATGFATPADVTASQGVITAAIGGLNDFDPASDVVAHVTLVDTTTDLTNGGGGGGGDSASDIYDYFTDGTRAEAFWADLAGISTFDPATDTVAHVTLVDTTTDLTNQSAGGEGMFQASVRVQDSSGLALQGARINVDGTTLSLTTGVDGEVVFNLDSGVYLLDLLPPANYDTPVGQVVSITSSDPAQTVFSLTQTSPPSSCTPPWLG